MKYHFLRFLRFLHSVFIGFNSSDSLNCSIICQLQLVQFSKLLSFSVKTMKTFKPSAPTHKFSLSQFSLFLQFAQFSVSHFLVALCSQLNTFSRSLGHLMTLSSPQYCFGCHSRAFRRTACQDAGTHFPSNQGPGHFFVRFQGILRRLQ